MDTGTVIVLISSWIDDNLTRIDPSHSMMNSHLCKASHFFRTKAEIKWSGFFFKMNYKHTA